MFNFFSTDDEELTLDNTPTVEDHGDLVELTEDLIEQAGDDE